MNPKEIVPEGAEWIHRALDRPEWRALASDNVNESSDHVYGAVYTTKSVLMTEQYFAFCCFPFTDSLLTL